MDRPAPPPEAVLLGLVLAASGMKAGDAAGEVARRFNRKFSASRWSQIQNGYETRDGKYKPVTASAATLAQMFAVVGGVTPERLAGGGPGEGHRPDAAEVLREILSRQEPRPEPKPDPADEEEDEALRSIMADTRLTLPMRRAIVAFAKAMKEANEKDHDGLGQDTA